MGRFRLGGAALSVAFVAGAFASTSASAVTFLLAEWLVNGSSVTSELLTETTGELLLEDSKTLVGKASVLCSGSLDGWIGPNSLDWISEMLTLSGVAVSTTVLTGTALECTAQSGCEAGTKPKVWLANLSWETEAELMETATESFFVDLILPHTSGGNPGWEAECTILGVKFVDECTAAESVAELKLEGTTLLEKFSKALSELAVVKLANCSQGGTESGVTEGEDSSTLSSGGELTASSGTVEAGGEPTSLSTVLSGEGKEGGTLTVLEGSKVKDKATLKGKNASSATGKVTYKVYSDSECKELVANAGEATVSGESVPASSEEELAGGASYYWQAHYSGDSKNAESTSECNEISTVKAKTTLSTDLSGESKEGEELTVLEGSKVEDKATLSGTKSSSAGGKVVYRVYSDNKCEVVVKEAGEVTVSSGSVPASSEEALLAGDYYWKAVYSGDSLHQGATSMCNSEVDVSPQWYECEEVSGTGEWEDEACSKQDSGKTGDFERVAIEPISYTSKGGEVKLEAGSNVITCKSSESSGYIEIPNHVNSVTTSFFGCKGEETSTKTTCEVKSVTPVGATEEIVFNTLHGVLGTVAEAESTTGIGISLSPEAAGPDTEVEGSCLSEKTSVLEGGMISEIAPINKAVENFELTSAISSKKDRISKFEAGSTETLKGFGATEVAMSYSTDPTFEGSRIGISKQARVIGARQNKTGACDTEPTAEDKCNAGTYFLEGENYTGENLTELTIGSTNATLKCTGSGISVKSGKNPEPAALKVWIENLTFSGCKVVGGESCTLKSPATGEVPFPWGGELEWVNRGAWSPLRQNGFYRVNNFNIEGKCGMESCNYIGTGGNSTVRGYFFDANSANKPVASTRAELFFSRAPLSATCGRRGLVSFEVVYRISPTKPSMNVYLTNG